MLVLLGVMVGFLLVFGPLVYWINKKAQEKYDRPAIGLLQCIYVAVSLIVFCVGVGNLPKEFALSHQEPITADEIEAAKQEWVVHTAKAEQDLASEQQRLDSASDALDKKDAAQRVKEARTTLEGYRNGAPSNNKTVWTPKVLLKLVSFPIAHSLEVSAWCFGISFAVMFGMFIYNGVQMDWLTATTVLTVQVVLAIPLLLFALMAFKALQNADRGKPMLSS